MPSGAIITTLGLAKLASATPLNQLNISALAVGDGNGGYPTLDPSMTALANEVWRGTPSPPIRDPNSPNVLIFEAVIPPSVGGFTVREQAIFDDAGDMIAIGQTSVVEKPLPNAATGVMLTVRLHVQLDNAEQVDLFFQDDPTISAVNVSNANGGSVQDFIDGLAVTDSDVLVGGFEAGQIANEFNSANALQFPDGAFWDSPVLSQRTMIDVKNFQGQDGTFPAKEPVIVHDYSDGRRTMQLDKVGGSAADYVLGLRRANNPINRPDKAADYVAPVGYLECSYDSFDGVGGAKLVNKSFYIDPNTNLVWTGKNGSSVTSAQFITLKPNGDGRYPFWFTATQEQDLFMRFSNPSGDVLTIRDDVGGTRTNILVDSNQTSGLRISCLAGTLDLDAGTNITIRKPLSTASGTDLTLAASKDILLNPVNGSTKCNTPFRLRSYSVSSAPDATNFDQHLIYVTNGDAGQPCLAVAQGGTWKRISLGAAISAT